MPRPSHGSLAAELELLSPTMRQALLAAVEGYRRTGVRFALCGGLAAGVYGEPRATRDIDFLVGNEAFLPGALLVLAKPLPLQAHGVAVDPIPLPEDAERAELLDIALDNAHVDTSLGVPVPVLQPKWLAYMKLAVGRAKDRADVVAMLASGAVSQADLTPLVQAGTPMGDVLKAVLDEWHRS